MARVIESQKLPRDNRESIFAARHQDVSQGPLGAGGAGGVPGARRGGDGCLLKITGAAGSARRRRGGVPRGWRVSESHWNPKYGCRGTVTACLPLIALIAWKYLSDFEDAFCAPKVRLKWYGFKGFPSHSSHWSGGLFPQFSGVSPVSAGNFLEGGWLNIFWGAEIPARAHFHQI